jgi:hypothetical protein
VIYTDEQKDRIVEAARALMDGSDVPHPATVTKLRAALHPLPADLILEALRNVAIFVLTRAKKHPDKIDAMIAELEARQ